MKTNKGDTPIQNDVTQFNCTFITMLISDTDKLSFVVMAVM